MLLVSARKVMAMPIEEVWEVLTGKFRLQFDDGEIVTNFKETIYSRYFWEFHNKNPNTSLLKRHHVQHTLNGKRAGMTTHLHLINTILWDTYDQNAHAAGINSDVAESYALAYRYNLAETAYEITNSLYNAAVSKLGEYVTSMDAIDFLEVFESKPIQASYDRAQPNETWIDDINSTIDDFLNNDPAIRNNPMSRLYRSGLVNKQQVHQCIGVRGYVDGIDNIRYQYPVMRGYFQGIRSAHDYIVEPQTAAMSLNSSKAPLQETEYFSRKLQLMCMTVERLHHTDCGSTRYIKVFVRPKTHNYKGDLCELLGKNYLDADGSLKTVKASDTHLENQTITVRSVIFCKHPDPRGVCAVCYGALSEQIPHGSNFGHINCVYMTEQSGQGVLSTKHSAKSSSVEGAVIYEDIKPFLKAGPDNNSYMFTDLVRDKARRGQAKLLISVSDALNLSDIQKIDKIDEIAVTRFSEIEICVLNLEGVDIALEVGDVKRKSSITHNMLAYINAAGIKKIEGDQFYEIDLTGWDFNNTFLALPLRNFSMADHSKDIAAILESSVTEAMERDRFSKPAAVLMDLFTLVNNRLSVNLAILEVTLYAAMIRSGEHYDYGLVKPHTESGLGVLKNVLMYRSGSAFMAYERHSEFINAPESFVLTNRMEHPFDAILMPTEVLANSNRRR